jgi:redox-sensitive bicupin YhaK (pirin superfamily)
MITLRRASERFHEKLGKREAWNTFHRNGLPDPLRDGFGVLEFLNESRLAPGAGTPRPPPRDAEIVTYVREGALAHEDSMGCSGVIQAGEFQRRTSGRGLRHSATNASRTDGAHVFEIQFHPSEAGLEPGYEQKRFSAAQRRDALCVVASSDARRGSLQIRQDALVFSAILDPGQHVIHEIQPGRSAWLHIVQGEAAFDGVVLTTGDGVGITAEPVVSLTAKEQTEILLVDLGVPPTR